MFLKITPLVENKAPKTCTLFTRTCYKLPDFIYCYSKHPELGRCPFLDYQQHGEDHLLIKDQATGKSVIATIKWEELT